MVEQGMDILMVVIHMGIAMKKKTWLITTMDIHMIGSIHIMVDTIMGIHMRVQILR